MSTCIGATSRTTSPTCTLWPYRSEDLFRDSKFRNKELAAILLSKLYFHLNDYKEALNYALKSGAYFNVEDHSDFTEVLVNKSIESYIDHAKRGVPLESSERYK